jgi:hypothetical protein
MPTKAELIKERVTQASRAMDNNPKLKKTKAVIKFGAPYYRLIAC